MKRPSRKQMQFSWKMHKLIWNASGGRLGRKIGGVPVLELVTTGHKSGQQRQILINYVDDTAGPAIIGTNAGKDVDPAWVKNLRAHPEARARWNGQWHDVTAVELDGDDHVRVWTRAVAAIPAFDDYREMLTRPIPIIRLEPRR